MADGALIDKRLMRRAFDRAAQSYDAAAVLQHEVRGRMLERLDYIRHTPQAILDAGTGTGGAIAALRERYPQAAVTALDIAPAMVARARERVPRWRRWIGLGGAMAFAASDTILAFDRFSSPIPGASWPIAARSCTESATLISAAPKKPFIFNAI